MIHTILFFFYTFNTSMFFAEMFSAKVLFRQLGRYVSERSVSEEV